MARILFIGGPGAITSSAVSEIVEKGWETGIFTHYKKSSTGFEDKVKFFWGDRDNYAQLCEVIENFKPDIAIDSVCYTPDQAKHAVKILSNKVSQYIFISTVDIYGYPLTKFPMGETDSFGTPNTKYSADKRACEEIFTLEYSKSKFPVTIARPAYCMSKTKLKSFIDGKGGKYLIPRIRAGVPVLVPGDGTTIHHPVSAYNVGRMIARMVGEKSAIGKSYNCVHPEMMTHEAYINLVGEIVGVKPNIVHIPTDFLLEKWGELLNDTILPVHTRFSNGFSVDRFKTDFPDFRWNRSIKDEIREYIDWHEKNNLFIDPKQEIAEDRIIDTWKELVRNFRV